MEWCLLLLIGIIGIPLMIALGVSLLLTNNTARHASRAKQQRENETSQAKAKHNDKVNQLVDRFLNAPFTSECARAILYNFQNDITDYTQKSEPKWVCKVCYDRIVEIRRSGIDRDVIKYVAKGYNTIKDIDELEAFAKAITRYLPSGFSYLEEKTDYSGLVFLITHDISIPVLKNIVDS